MAAALIQGRSDESYHSVFIHSLNLPAYLAYVGTRKVIHTPCTAIFSMDDIVAIETNNATICCKVEIWMN